MRSAKTIVIEPRKGWQLINWREILEYKDLFYFQVLREIKVLYKQTVLGFAWAIINPLLTMIIFTVIFGNLAKVSSDGSPYYLFSFAAVVPWAYFAQALSSSTNSLVGATNVFTKVYFPRLIIPIAPVVAKLADFLISFIILNLIFIFSGYIPTWKVIYIPYLLIIMIMTASGMGMWLSALAVQYRDIRFATTFLVQLLQYAAPVIFSGTVIPEKWRLVYGLYPMAGVIEGFRSAFLDRPMQWDYIMMGSISAVIIFITGAFYFRRMESKFADVA